MNKTIKFLFILLLPITFALGLIFTLPNPSNAYAEETVEYTEASYAKMWINDLAGYTADSAVRDTKTGNITSVAKYGRFGYNGGYQNVEISTIINFTTLGNITFTMRATGDTLYPSDSTSWTNRGYFIRLYSNARFDFVKNSGKVYDGKWPSHKAFKLDTDYKVTIKIVDLYDAEGNFAGVRTSLYVSDIHFFTHDDTTDKVAGSWFAVCSGGSEFSARGNGFIDNSIDLNEKSVPIKSANFPSTIDRNKIVSTETGHAGSGVGYTFQTKDFYSVKTLFKPSTAEGRLTMTIGSYKTNDKPLNRDDVISEGWGWKDTGYVVKWTSNGQKHFLRNNAVLEYTWDLPKFTAGQEYEVEFGVTSFEDGSNRLHLKIDGDIKGIYFDRPTADYTPISLSSLSTDPEGPTISSLIITSDVNATLTPVSLKGQVIPVLSSNAVDNNCLTEETITLSSSVAGVEYFIDQTLSTATAQITGAEITPTSAGSLVVYCKVGDIFSNDLVLTVSEKLEPIIPTVTNIPQSPIIVGGEKYTVSYAYEGEVESVEYSIENLSGMATINSQTGEITAVKAGNVKVYVTVNGTKSEGCIINISPKIEIKNTMALAVGEERILGYEANCTLPDETIITTYELIEGSAHAELDSSTGKIKAKSIGIIRVRVTVQGETFQAVSPSTSMAIEAPVVVLRNVKDLYVGQTHTLLPQINEGLIIKSKEIIVTSGQSLVRVNGDTITALGEGTVKLKAVINGYESAVLQFAITELTATIIATDMPTQSTQTLNVMFNFEEVQIDSVEYSILSGNKYATLENGVLTSLEEKGQVKIKAIVNAGGRKYTATETIEIIYKVRLTGIKETERIGDEIELSYFFYDGNDNVTSVEYVIVSGSDLATLTQDGQKGYLKINRPGTIKIKVIVNGTSSSVITVKAVADHNKLASYIVWSCTGIIIGSVGIGFLAKYLRKRKKSKKANSKQTNENVENKSNEE